jgi:dihydrodipicolinate synthase/N-acetylneuraminate lyase
LLKARQKEKGMTNEFKGVFPPVITPLTTDGKVNEAAYRTVLDFQIGEGAHGFWVCGAAGEGFVLRDEERIRIAEVSADQVRGRAKTIMHVGATTTESAVRIAKGSEAAGVDAIASVPPLLYKTSDDGIVAYYRALAEAVDLPLFVYNLPGITGVEVTPPLMKRLVEEVPQIAGIKHSALNFFNTYGFNQLGIAVFIGNSGLFLPALTIGAIGTIGSPLNVAPRIYADVYDAYLKGDLAKAEKLQQKGAAINSFCFQFPHIALYKTILSERLGIDCGKPRPTVPHLTEEQSHEALGRAKELGLL